MKGPRRRHHQAHSVGSHAKAEPNDGAAPSPAEDPYARVTQRIIEALEAGTIPWRKPWAALGGLPRNLVSKRPYRGMNVVLLSLGQPYTSPWWLTYRQAHALGGHVRKGEQASLVTFWKLPDRPKPEEGEEPTEAELRRGPILRPYHVFNVEQCEGIAAPKVPGFQPQAHQRLAACEAIIAAMPSRPTLGRDPRQAYYAPALDLVAMPDLAQFETVEGYYSTLFHELVHSTGHPSRLARGSLGTPAPFGSPDYSKEELVAEFGAAFLCAQAGIFPATVESQASYIDGWLAVLKKDKRLLPIAAAQAQRAADFILGSQPELTLEAEREPGEEATGRAPPGPTP